MGRHSHIRVPNPRMSRLMRTRRIRPFREASGGGSSFVFFGVDGAWGQITGQTPMATTTFEASAQVYIPTGTDVTGPIGILGAVSQFIGTGTQVAWELALEAVSGDLTMRWRDDLGDIISFDRPGIYPFDEWFDVTIGHDGANPYFEVNGDRVTSLPVTYTPTVLTEFRLLGDQVGAYAPGIRVRNIVVNDGVNEIINSKPVPVNSTTAENTGTWDNIVVSNAAMLVDLGNSTQATYGALTLAGAGGLPAPDGATSVTDGGGTNLTISGGQVVPATNGVSDGLVIFDNGAAWQVTAIADRYSAIDDTEVQAALADMGPGTDRMIILRGDTEPPVVSSSDYTNETKTISMSVVENSGTARVYWALVTNPSTPTEAQVIAGAGGGILEAGNFVVSAGSNSDVISVSNEAGDELHLVLVDASGNSTGTPSGVNNTIITGVTIGDLPITSLTFINDSSYSAVQFETGAFTPTAGATLLVLVPVYHTATTALTFDSATIGTAGRAYGTGTSLGSPIESAVSGNCHYYVYRVENASASSVTVQIDATTETAPRSIAIRVYEITGAATSQATAASNSGGDFATSANASVTTTGSNSYVVYALARAYDAADPISWTGVDGELETGDTGGTNAFQDAMLTDAYQLVATAGATGASSSWTTARYNTWAAVEVLF